MKQSDIEIGLKYVVKLTCIVSTKRPILPQQRTIFIGTCTSINNDGTIVLGNIVVGPLMYDGIKILPREIIKCIGKDDSNENE